LILCAKQSGIRSARIQLFKLKTIHERESIMALMVWAQVIRELIADGEYLVECIERRDRGKVAVAFALRSRAEPYSIQIETMDNKLAGLFRAMLDEAPPRATKPALVQIGSQPVPVVEVDSVPADAAKGRRRRKQGGNDADGTKSVEPAKPKTRSRSSAQQLALVPQDPPKKPAPVPRASKRRRTAQLGDLNETR
jgi:hypothetical protein